MMMGMERDMHVRRALVYMYARHFVCRARVNNMAHRKRLCWISVRRSWRQDCKDLCQTPMINISLGFVLFHPSLPFFTCSSVTFKAFNFPYHMCISPPSSTHTQASNCLHQLATVVCECRSLYSHYEMIWCEEQAAAP